MATERKKELVRQYQEGFSAAKSVVFTDYRGLTHEQLEELRSAVEEAGGSYTVAKNTLLKLALAQAPRKARGDSSTSDVGSETSDVSLAAKTLRGPTAILFSLEDEVTALKALSDFIDQHEKPTIKAGILGEEFIDKTKVVELAKLPSFENLIAQLIAQLQSPVRAVTLQLNAPIQRLIMDLKEIEQRNR